jgi:hypothetical protein
VYEGDWRNGSLFSRDASFVVMKVVLEDDADDDRSEDDVWHRKRMLSAEHPPERKSLFFCLATLAASGVNFQTWINYGSCVHEQEDEGLSAPDQCRTHQHTTASRTVVTSYCHVDEDDEDDVADENSVEGAIEADEDDFHRGRCDIFESVDDVVKENDRDCVSDLVKDNGGDMDNVPHWIANKPWSPDEERQLELLGGMLVPGVVPASVCREVLEDAAMECQSRSVQFSDIKKRGNGHDRVDVLMRFTPAVRELVGALQKHFGWDNHVVECSVITTKTGARNQPMHTDSSGARGEAVLLTIGVALVPISESQGPTEIRLGTHTEYWHDDDNSGSEWEEPMITSGSFCVGDVVIWDSRVHHRGTAHVSGPPRSLLVLSVLRGPGVRPDGPTYSLRNEYPKSVPVGTIVDALPIQLTKRTNEAIFTARDLNDGGRELWHL